MATSPTAVTDSIMAPASLDIGAIMKSKGPIVKAVLLRSDGTIDQVDVDTTPQEQHVSKLLGGPFTFLGQYHDEGLMLMIRRPDENENDNNDTTTTTTTTLTKNQHSLQPPFDTATVHGNILAIKVADVDDDEVANNTTNEDFFLDYTKEEYLAFAARTDVVPPTVSEEDMEEAEEDPEEEEEEEEDEEMQSEEEEDEEEDENGFLELLMGQVLKRFQEENGREPEEHELQALQAAIVQKMGGAME